MLRPPDLDFFSKRDFSGLLPVVKELKSLIYDYKDKKELEIKELNKNHDKMKNEIEMNQKSYEKLIDEAAEEISSFVEKVNLEKLS